MVSSKVHARAAGLEDRDPVVGLRRATTYQSRLGFSRLDARLLEPRVLVGAVVRDPVQDDLDVARVALRDQLVEVRERAEHRVDVAVVGDVVAEVGHRATVKIGLTARSPRPRAPARWSRRARDARRGPPRRRRRSPRTSAGRSGRWRAAATRPARTSGDCHVMCGWCAVALLAIAGMLLLAALAAGVRRRLDGAEGERVRALRRGVRGRGVARVPGDRQGGGRRARGVQAPAPAEPPRGRGRAALAPPPATATDLEDQAVTWSRARTACRPSSAYSRPSAVASLRPAWTTWLSARTRPVSALIARTYRTCRSEVV